MAEEDTVGLTPAVPAAGESRALRGTQWRPIAQSIPPAAAAA